MLGVEGCYIVLDVGLQRAKTRNRPSRIQKCVSNTLLPSSVYVRHMCMLLLPPILIISISDLIERKTKKFDM